MTTKSTESAAPGRAHGALAAAVLGGSWVLALVLVVALVRPAGAGLEAPLVGPVVAWLVLTFLVVAAAWTMRPSGRGARAWWPTVAAVAAYTFFLALYPYLVSRTLWEESSAPVDPRLTLLLMLLGAVVALLLLARWLGNVVFEYLKRRHGL